MNIFTRHPTFDDIDELKLLTYDDTLIDLNHIDKWLIDSLENRQILLLIVDTNIAGVICWDLLWQNSVPLISWLKLKPEYQKQNITPILTSAALEILKNKGYKKILYGIYETVKDPSSISPHGYLEWPGKGKEFLYWMKIG